MTRGEIKTAIKNGVDDQTINDVVLNIWLQQTDDKVQTWRPLRDQDQTFDYWDYLKDQKNYTTTANKEKYSIPDDYRAFIELKINNDTEPYKLIDFRDREKYSHHVIWILGKYFYVKGTPSESGNKMELTYVRMTEPFTNDADEPEIERIYHPAYIAFGKAMYYNQQGDTELENQNMNEFERVMLGKWRDQEMARMASAAEQMSIPQNYLV